MRILLDTNTYIWSQLDSQGRLTPAARAVLSGASEIFVSSASIWEIAIKSALGRMSGEISALMDLPRGTGLTELPVFNRHAAHVVNLPHHHGDPFDRILVAQAQVEELTLLTADSQLSAYGGFVQVI